MSDVAEYVYDPDSFAVTSQMRQDYKDYGYVIIRNLFDIEDVKSLLNFFETSEEIEKYAYGRDDGHKGQSRSCLWNYPGNDIPGMVSRMEKVAGTMEQLMGGDEIYHYHSKIMMKNAHTGGKHNWHQDYGYWYRNGCLFPDMGSVFIALDKCTRQNSCLQILRSSHKIGRIDHVRIGDQVGADLERVEEAKKHLDHVYVEMEPGDAIFFHCNILHTSDQNHSDMRRWVMIATFNKRSNDPYKKHHHPQYTPLLKVGNDAIKTCEVATSTEEKWYFDLKDDVSIKFDGH